MLGKVSSDLGSKSTRNSLRSKGTPRAGGPEFNNLPILAFVLPTGVLFVLLGHGKCYVRVRNTREEASEQVPF